MDLLTNEAWHTSLADINFRAWANLNHSAQLRPSVSGGRLFNGLPRLRLWDEAAGLCAHQPCTLTVYEPHNDNFQREPIVREAVWQRSADMERVEEEVKRVGQAVNLTPTIRIRDVVLPAEAFNNLLAEAVQFRLPVVWFNSESESVTSDAGSYGFEFFTHDQPPAVLRLTWSYNIPPEWEPVQEWFWRLRQFLESCLPPM